MTQKCIGQARGAAANLAGKAFLLKGWNGSENTTPLADLQAATLACRFGLAPSRARLVAGLAVETGRDR